MNGEKATRQFKMSEHEREQNRIRVARHRAKKKGENTVKVEEIKQMLRLSGFNSIFCVSSVEAAKLYYNEFKKQMAANPEKSLKIATIYSYGQNEDDPDGFIDDEDSDVNYSFAELTKLE